MAGSSIKLGVDVTEFKRGMTEAQTSVKTLDAAIKTNEKSMQAYGKSESYVSTQTNLLNSKLKEQEKIVQNAEKSLKAMEENGVSKSSKAYQDMQRKLLEARGAMIDTTVQINQLTTEEADAAKGADELANSIGNIGKKMSLGQVISGIDSVTSALGNAARSAIDLGEKLFDAILDSAAAADDISTMAEKLGLTDEQVQQINYNAARFEVTAEQLGKTWKKVKVNMASDSDEIKQAFEELGIQTHEVFGGKYGSIEGDARDYQDVFWEVGDALMRMTDEAKREQLAQKLLGRSWDEMIPLFTKGRAVYEAALNAAPTASEEAVENMASLNDRMKELEQSWETLKLEALGAIAPALEKGADAIANLIDKITAYLKTDAGQQLLQNLGEAVGGLLEDLNKIDPEKAAQGFVDLFTKVTDGIQWLVDNQETAKGILGAIVAGWGTLTLTETVLKVVNFVNGITGLTAGSVAGNAAAAGASWGSAFASAALKAAPWLAGLITLLTPGEGGNSDFISPEGKLTDSGYQALSDQGWENPEYKKILMELGEIYGADQLRGLINNDAAAAAILTYLYSGHQGRTLDFANNVLSGYNGVTFGEGWRGVEFTEEELKEILSPHLNPVIEIPEDAALKISEQIGVVPVTVQPVVPNDEPEYIPGGGGGGNNVAMEKANGIWAVPFDGYLARLHKNERVVPAREIASHSYSSNLYVESMIMNNGTYAEGLAAAMAAAQRRTMTGFGS